jgi:hypothetical protein
MVAGERAALEGVLTQLRPRLAVEIGTAQGGSLRCLARHCAAVHSFDLHHPAELAQLENVELHTGDSHQLLPRMLRAFEDAEKDVDFALVDGDHSAEGVRRDVGDLLSSRAVRETVILAHDAANDEVHAGLERVDFSEYGKVTLVDLDFVAGHLSRTGPFAGQLWGGLALIMVDEAGATGAPVLGRPDQYSTAEVLRAGLVRLRQSPDGPVSAPGFLRRWLPQRLQRRKG